MSDARQPEPVEPAGGSPEERLTALGLVLPPPPRPVAAYVPARLVGSLLFISGQIPLRDGELMAQGTVPGQVPVATAVLCARQCVLNGLSAARAVLGSLDRVRSVVRVGCFVASERGFHGQPEVANGASHLLEAVFGPAGRHARVAVGSVDLPLGAPVEVELLLEVTAAGVQDAARPAGAVPPNALR